MWAETPAFLVRLAPSVNRREATFHPPLESVAASATAALDAFLSATSGIPRVGVDPATAKSSDWIPTVGLHEPVARDARTKVRDAMTRAELAPRSLAKLFDPHMELLTMDVEAYLETFSAAEKKLEVYAEAIDEYQARAEAIEATSTARVRCGMYEVDCSGLKRTLADAASNVARLLLEQVRETATKSKTKVVKAYEHIRATVTKESETGEQCVALKKYMKFLPEELDTLKTEIAANQARDEFLEGYFHDVPEEDFQLSVTAYGWPLKMKELLIKASVSAEKEFRKFEAGVKQRRKDFAERLEQFKARIAEFEETDNVVEREDIANKVRALVDDLAAAQTESEEINVEELLFSFAPTKYGPQINSMNNALDPFKKLWITTQTMFKNHRDWLTGPFSALDPDKIDEDVGDAYRIVFKLQKVFSGLTGGDRLPGPLKVAMACLDKIEDFKTYTPLINAVCNPGLRDRHWTQMTDVIGVVGFELKKDDHTLAPALARQGRPGTSRQADGVLRLGEPRVELREDPGQDAGGLEGVEVRAQAVERDGHVHPRGGPIDEAQALLDDHIVKTQAMRASPFAKPHIDRIIPWEAKLTRLQDIVDQWLKCQSKWLYLEPIFGSEEIMKQIPKEGAAFKNMDATWRRIIEDIRAKPAAIGAPDIPDLLEDLENANRELDVVEKGLNDFLDLKKLAFPRFFFLSNDELLEILSEAKDPLRVQPFMKKCFEAVREVEFTEKITMTSMISVEGEQVPLCKEIDPAETGAGGEVDARVRGRDEGLDAQGDGAIHRRVRSKIARGVDARVARSGGDRGIAGALDRRGDRGYRRGRTRGFAEVLGEVQRAAEQHRQHGARRTDQTRARDDVCAGHDRRPRPRCRRADGEGRGERREGFQVVGAAAVFLGGRHPQGSDDQRRGAVRIRVPGQLVAASHHPADGSMLSHADGGDSP